MTNQSNSAQAATQEAVQRALELYAECYDTMTRIAHREGREPVVSPVSVAIDIRRNMVNDVLRTLSLVRAPVADERAAFERLVCEWNQPMDRQGWGYVDPKIQDAWWIWNMSRGTHLSDTRGALVSAPVADERAPPPLPEVMMRTDWLRGYADTAEMQAKSYSHGTMYSIAKALREIAGWCDARAALSAQPKTESRVGTNTGHGHVWARPDGLKVRCGGPGICIMCSKDHAHATQEPSK